MVSVAHGRALLVAICAGVSWGQLVAPGALVPGGGGGAGPVGRSRSGGWGVVSKWPVGFFVGGSSVSEMNGVYVRAEGVDHALPHYCAPSWKNVDNDFKIASTDVDGWAGVKGATKEWLLIDADGRDMLASPGGHYIPPAATGWQIVKRPYHYWKRGDLAAAQSDVDGFWKKGERGRVMSVDEPDATTCAELASSTTLHVEGVRTPLRAMGGV